MPAKIGFEIESVSQRAADATEHAIDVVLKFVETGPDVLHPAAERGDRQRWKALAMLLTVLTLSPSLAAAPKAQSPALILRLDDCKRLADQTRRLACYEATADEIILAIEAKQLVAMDELGMRQTRRSLFGFNLPPLSFLKGSGDAREEVELHSTIASASPLARGRWQIQMDDGAIWQTIEVNSNAREPRAGLHVRIRRGAIGCYLMNIDKQRALRVRRLNSTTEHNSAPSKKLCFQ